MFLYEGIEQAAVRTRAVLVGCGEQATNMIHDAISFIDEIEVVGVCDLNKSRADFAARRFGLPRSYQDMGEMLKEVPAEIAFVVSIAKLQPILAKQCVEAGLNVYTEKPSGVETEDIEALIAAGKKMGKLVGVSFNKRYALAYHSMKEAIESEEFGKPSLFCCRFIGGYRSNETDLLRVGCCHFFDLSRYLIGELESVNAYRYEKTAGQHMIAVSGKFRNGCVASMSFGSLGSWVNGYGMEEVEVWGDRNMVRVENGRDFMWQKASRIVSSDTGLASAGTQAVTEKAVPVEITRINYANLGKLATKDFYINGNYQCIRAFADAVISGATPDVTVRDGLQALKIAMAVERSVKEERPVAV